MFLRFCISALTLISAGALLLFGAEQVTPLSKSQLAMLMICDISNDRLVTIVQKRGVDFAVGGSSRVFAEIGDDERLLGCLRSLPPKLPAKARLKHTEKLVKEQNPKGDPAVVLEAYNNAEDRALEFIAKAKRLMDEKLFREAIEEIWKAGSFMPWSPELKMAVAHAYLSRYVRTELWSTSFAINLLEDAVLMGPDVPEAHACLAEAYAASGLRARALFHYRRAEKKAPEWAEIKTRGQEFNDKERYSLKIKNECRAASVQAPANPNVRINCDRQLYSPDILEGFDGVGWWRTQSRNTRSGYEKFVRNWPESMLANEARERAQNPDYALLVSIQLGTKEALKGYCDSHPDSAGLAVLGQLAGFLEGVKQDNVESARRFIAEQSDTPFRIAAGAAFPLMWLEDNAKRGPVKVALTVNVGELANRGLLMGGRGKEEEVLARLEGELNQALRGVGVEVSKIQAEADYLISLTYSRVQVQQSGSSIPYSGGNLAGTLHNAAVDNLTNMFAVLTSEVRTVVVTRTKDSAVLYKVAGLSSARGFIDWVKLLEDDSSTGAKLLRMKMELSRVNLLDTEQRARAETMLHELKDSWR